MAFGISLYRFVYRICVGTKPRESEPGHADVSCDFNLMSLNFYFDIFPLSIDKFISNNHWTINILIYDKLLYTGNIS